MSPMIWAAICTVLFLAAKEKCYGDDFRAPITKLITLLAIFIFVDDTDFIQTHTYSTELLSLIVDELQGSLNV